MEKANADPVESSHGEVTDDGDRTRERRVVFESDDEQDLMNVTCPFEITDTESSPSTSERRSSDDESSIDDDSKVPDPWNLTMIFDIESGQPQAWRPQPSLLSTGGHDTD